ncbi:MAG: hypothetical protein SF097_25025 [Acidobacteriota bacterium]|nr:hypothetical protein [Acidobacteriota bacterium]
MKLRNFVTGSAILLMVFAVGVAAAKANFSGTWIMDKSKSEGLPPEMEQTMVVTQEGDKLTLETTLINGEQKQTIKDSYTLNGTAEDFAPRVGGMTGKGKRTAKWSADGNGIEVSEDAKLETPDGEANTTMKRKWVLSADGKTLTIELQFNGPNGEVVSKRTFAKK